MSDEKRERIGEIRGRHAKATTGPWKVYEFPNDERRIGTERDHPQLKAPAPVVNTGWGVWRKDDGTTEPWQGIRIREDDAEFIAHSWGDIRYLLSRIEQLEQERDKLYEAVQKQLRQQEEERGQIRRKAREEALREAAEVCSRLAVDAFNAWESNGSTLDEGRSLGACECEDALKQLMSGGTNE